MRTISLTTTVLSLLTVSLWAQDREVTLSEDGETLRISHLDPNVSVSLFHSVNDYGNLSSKTHSDFAEFTWKHTRLVIRDAIEAEHEMRPLVTIRDTTHEVRLGRRILARVQNETRSTYTGRLLDQKMALKAMLDGCRVLAAVNEEIQILREELAQLDDEERKHEAQQRIESLESIKHAYVEKLSNRAEQCLPPE